LKSKAVAARSARAIPYRILEISASPISERLTEGIVNS
jgi:hypothetical protein